ncbi:hypothetical protein [Leptospira noguchii]|uniref:Lipoprotein n=1 Tax=Leptospira noguchii serovar Autumnalis str. ZUN142 TaxID=1085540 RepID=M6UAY3_9LEPT|nr:hypothetical protein [Leptospira noguchii]EMO40076.1 hypothetical protein LEP1GSC186_1446 [Leptospira noguchii serovar Autumnalis str. ZUN142]TQE83213.1 hypothetical protein FF021_01620 [Leptospira noguchii]UOG51989.1 hypothetical protein MAL09_15290 [Leptospira noguchii]
MKMLTSLFLVVFALFMANCKSSSTTDVVKTSKGFYRFYKTRDFFSISSSKVEFCAIDAKTSAITCKDVTVNYGF